MRMPYEEAGYRPRASRQIGLRRRLWDDVKALGALLLLWQERARQRHHLAKLSDHMRHDLGLSDADVFRETRKPFWEP